MNFVIKWRVFEKKIYLFVLLIVIYEKYWLILIRLIYNDGLLNVVFL